MAAECRNHPAAVASIQHPMKGKLDGHTRIYTIIID